MLTRRGSGSRGSGSDAASECLGLFYHIGQTFDQSIIQSMPRKSLKMFIAKMDGSDGISNGKIVKSSLKCKIIIKFSFLNTQPKLRL